MEPDKGAEGRGPVVPDLGRWLTILSILAAILGAGIWLGSIQKGVNSLDPSAIQRAKAEALQAIAEAKQSGAVKDDVSRPLGSVLAFVGPVEQVPSGWLLCDGRTLPVARYGGLYRAIGVTWGGEKEVYFRLPDLRGEFLRGADNGRGVDPDKGRKVGTPQTDAVKAHTHPLDTNIGKYGWSGGSGGESKVKAVNSPGEPTMKVLANGSEIETRPRNVAVNYIIFVDVPEGVR